MNLSVHVLGREVAMLEAVGDFKSSMVYHDAGYASAVTRKLRRLFVSHVCAHR